MIHFNANAGCELHCISFDLVFFISIILTHSQLLFSDVCRVSNHLVQLTANSHSDPPESNKQLMGKKKLGCKSQYGRPVTISVTS